MIKSLIQGAADLFAKLANLDRRARNQFDGTVVVGYEAPYAIFVHEDMQVNHPNGGSAKFLEIPMRAQQFIMSGMIREAMRKGLTLQKAQIQAATFLKEQSQMLCPVDTGFLRDSAYVGIIRDEGGVIEKVET